MLFVTNWSVTTTVFITITIDMFSQDAQNICMACNKMLFLLLNRFDTCFEFNIHTMSMVYLHFSLLHESNISGDSRTFIFRNSIELFQNLSLKYKIFSQIHFRINVCACSLTCQILNVPRMKGQMNE